MEVGSEAEIGVGVGVSQQDPSAGVRHGGRARHAQVGVWSRWGVGKSQEAGEEGVGKKTCWRQCCGPREPPVSHPGTHL